MITNIHQLPNRTHKNSKSRSKSKSKSKGKNNFNALKYLHVDMDIPAPKKKLKGKEHKSISNTLQILTPLPSNQTFTKCRSKTSSSQYRRRDTSIMKDLINLNLQNIVTEDDCIRYTQSVIIEQSNQPKSVISPILKIKMSEQTAAKIIQRAWKKHLTLNMIKKYYKHYSGLAFEDLKMQQQTQLEKTLKIRSDIKAHNHYSFTRKNSAQELNQRIKDYMETPSPKCIKYKQKEDIVLKMKSVQAKRWEQLMKMIQNQRKENQGQGVIGQVLKKLQENKQNLQKEIQSEQNSLFQTPLLHQNQNQQSSIVRRQSNSNNLQSFTNKLISHQSLHFNRISQSSECQLLRRKITNIKNNRESQIAKLRQLKQSGSIAQYQMKSKILQLNYNTSQEIKYLQNIIKSYENIMESITNIAIQQYQLLSNSKSSSKFRKCFSSQTIILKHILKQQKIQSIQISAVEVNKKNEQLDGIKQQENDKSNESFSIVELRPQIAQQIQLDNDQGLLSDSLMRQCSQQYQKQIQQLLIEEVALQIYTSQMYKHFKSEVEKQHQFPKITDGDIAQFLTDIKMFYPPNETLLKLFNQKINPTPLEILKIIRDQQCQLDEYEIILSENVFLKYRLYIEEKYQDKKKIALEEIRDIDDWVKDNKTKNKILQRIGYKKLNLVKYLQFQKDLRIIYLKSVFNCLNEYIIEYKSFCTAMNVWSSIGPGQLTMSLKEYNKISTEQEFKNTLEECKNKIIDRLKCKCVIPNFNNIYNLQLFYKFSQLQLQMQFNQTQYKWVNFMDESLQIWMDLSQAITALLITEVVNEMYQL